MLSKDLLLPSRLTVAELWTDLLLPYGLSNNKHKTVVALEEQGKRDSTNKCSSMIPYAEEQICHLGQRSMNIQGEMWKG